MTRGQKVCLAIAAACSWWANAAPPVAIEDEAAAILDRSVEASGGKPAHLRIQNRESRIRMEILGMGIVLNGTIISARPNLNYTVMESPVTGKTERGSDGRAVWANSVTTGPQWVEGAEREEFLYQAQFDRLVDWRRYHSAAAVAGIAEAGGKACRRVLLTPNRAKPQTLCFDSDSGLLTGLRMKATTPGGEIEIEVLITDYREVDGVKLPFTIKTRLPGQERVTTVEKVTHNQDVPPSRFTPPGTLAESI